MTAFITPKGAGRKDGTSWSDAATLRSLPTLVAGAEPGGEIWIRGGVGAYYLSSPIELAAGGEPGAPIVIRGVAEDGSTAERPEIVGQRAAPYDPRGPAGREGIRLRTGASHLRFYNLGFRNLGNGAVRIAGDLHDLVLQNIWAWNVRRFLENYAMTEDATATVRDLLLSNIEIRGFSKGAIRLRYDSSHVVIENLWGDSERQDYDNFAIGVTFHGTVHDVILRRVSMLNCQMTRDPGEYWNGDGFVSERGTHHLRYEETYSAGHTDAGYDLKSDETVLVRAVAEDNKRNYRLWGRGIVLEDCQGLNPFKRGGIGTQAQVHVTAEASVCVRDSTFTGGDANTVVFDADQHAYLDLQGGQVSYDPAATVATVETDAAMKQEGVTFLAG